MLGQCELDYPYESAGEVGRGGERYSIGREAFSCRFDSGVVGGSSGGGVSVEV